LDGIGKDSFFDILTWSVASAVVVVALKVTAASAAPAKGVPSSYVSKLCWINVSVSVPAVSASSS
jgi:hypothetical protein